jgi:predicted amidohydrolase YtcJ
MTGSRASALLALGLSALVGACDDPGARSDAVSERRPADLLLTHGAVYTMDPSRPRAEAVAIGDGRILAVGSTREITGAWKGPERDLGGRMVLPAFHDAHAHPIGGGFQLGGCDLSPYPQRDALLARILECAQADPDAEWVIGEGWELSAFPPEGDPHKDLLDAIDATRPLLMRGADGHSTWVNSAALERAGIDAGTPDPRNGVIERDPDGSPSGTLRESAQALVERVAPPVTHEQRLDAARRAVAHMNAFGITSFVDASVGEEELAVWRELEASGELTARVVASVRVLGMSDSASAELIDVASRGTDALVRADSAKFFLDGVLEGETAALLEPYLGRDGASGTLNANFEDLLTTVLALDAQGVQIHMHAIGDAAVRQGLDALELAREANGPNEARHHICHLQLVHPDDHARFGELEVRANFQALWAYPDAYITDVNLPVVGQARVDRMYPMGSILRSGGTIVAGSDWPVSTVNPLPAIEVALTRRDPSGVIDAALTPAEAVPLDTMLAAYTRETALLMHQEDRTGRIAPGLDADLVVLERDLHAIPPEAIGEVPVTLTLFRGRVVHERDEG